MLHLFVRTPFEDWGEYPSGWTSLSQMLAEITVALGVAALALTLCRALLVLSFGETLDGFGPPTSQHITLCM